MQSAVRALFLVAVICFSGTISRAGTLEIRGSACVPLSCDELDLTSGIAPLSQTATASTAGHGALFRGYAEFGLLGSHSGAEAESIDVSTLAFASGTASWSDTFRIVAANPALAGTQGSFSFVSGVSGAGGVTGEALPPGQAWFGLANWSASLLFPSSPLPTPATLEASGQWMGSQAGPATYTGDLPGAIISGTVQFVFGSDIAIQARLWTQVQAESEGGGRAESTANFLGTLRWGGFTEVRDAEGRLLSPGDYSVQSDSETDWSRAAVPEPSTFLLVGLALAALAGSAGSPRGLRRG